MNTACPASLIRPALRGYLVATAGVALLTALSHPLVGQVEPTNMVMLYLLLVVAVALRYPHGPAAWSAIAGVLAFDYFHVPPRLSFEVGDVQYLLTFAVMLIVGLLLAQLTTRLRLHAVAARAGELAAQRQYELARALSGTIAPEQVCALLAAFAAERFGGRAELWWQSSSHALGRIGPPHTAGNEALYRALVETVMREGRAHDQEDLASPGEHLLMLPLDAPMRRRGVLVLCVPEAQWSPELPLALGNVALVTAIALERLHYVSVAQQATVEMERERLRSTLLSALSHDIRTPLTVMVGQAEALAEAPAGRVREQAQALREQALRMSELVNKLLDMARLQASGVSLRRDWQSVEEIVGAALAHLGEALAAHRITLALAPDLPLLEFDAVLIERVLCNLLENAAKFSPAGREIRIEALGRGEVIEIAVADEGVGVPAEHPERLFEAFVRGEAQGAVTGLGLGLSICRIIVEAHGGSLQAENRAQGGARFSFTLPCSAQPPMLPESESAHV
ncbi:DUF4118 domain-containing protein [Uliginosibacterium paludis]|uniref:histidine kinase n=1 Tax=Uliginosibacterium paludis TaxID=1615952 RepID=A0ABV2CR56_9RHOO